MKVVVGAVTKLGLEFDSPDNQVYFILFSISVNIESPQASADRIAKASSSGDDWSVEIGNDIHNLWSDSATRSAVQKRDEIFQLNDSAE
jgi:hypothetical protein